MKNQVSQYIMCTLYAEYDQKRNKAHKRDISVNAFESISLMNYVLSRLWHYAI